MGFLYEQTRNLLRIAIFNISYIRGLFPEKYFNDKSVPALGLPFFSLILSTVVLKQRIRKCISVIFLLLIFLFDRNEDQEANADGCRVSKADWLDGERYWSMDLLRKSLLSLRFWCVRSLRIVTLEFEMSFRFIFYPFLERCLWCVAEEVPENAAVLHLWSDWRADDWGICL